MILGTLVCSRQATADDFRTPSNSGSQRSRFIAIGESLQNSSDLQSFEQQMITTLIEENGYRGIIMEETDSALEPVREYLTSNCSGTSSGAIEASSMKDFWKQSRAVHELFQWLCVYNRKALLSPVLVYGNDSFEIEWATRLLSKKAATAGGFAKTGCLLDSTEESADGDVAGLFTAFISNPNPPADKSPLTNCVTRIRSVMQSLSTGKEPEKVRAARTLVFAYDHLRNYRANIVQAYAARDRIMFDNTEDLLQKPLARKRVIFWGHISHFLRGPGDPDANNFGVQTMGYFLGKRYAKDYQVMGVVSSKSKDNWGFSNATVDKLVAALGPQQRKVFQSTAPELSPFPWKSNLDLLMVVKN